MKQFPYKYSILNTFVQQNNFETTISQDHQLGSMAFQINICTYHTGMAMVYSKIGLRMVLYTQ